MHLLLGGEPQIDTLGCICRHLLHLRQHHLLEAVPSLRQHVQVALELVVGDLVEGFELTIVRVVLLDCVVGKVNVGLKGIVGEGVGGCADVALFVPVGAGDSVEVGDEEIVSNVELALIVKEGSVDVLLHDVGLRAILELSRLSLALLDEVVQLIDLVDHHDPIAPVAVLPRLHDPDVPLFALRL